MIVGTGTYGTEHIRLLNWDQGTDLIIGNYCSIANPVTVLLGGNHNMNRVTTFPFGIINGLGPMPNKDGYSNGNVVIGNDVWVGHNVTIMSGVTIGDGCVVAACSVIVKDIPPYSIVGGNPAKLIKKRFSDEQIEKLLQIKWWNWHFDKIKQFANLLLDPDIDAFINSAFN